MYYIPTVVDNTNNVEKFYDIFSRLLKERIIFLNGQIDDYTTSVIIAQLLFLESDNSSKDIFMYINSPGGIITSGLGIYDTMRYIKPAISTVCVGQACSMGAFLLSAGTKGKRYALPNSKIMIHQPLGGYNGQATDFAIHAKEIIDVKRRINTLLSKHTGQKISRIEKDVDRDHFMSAEEGLKYGLIDKIIYKREEK